MWSWEHGSMGAWEHGSMGAWGHVVMWSWEHGSMGAWEHGGMGAWEHVVMGHEGMGQRWRFSLATQCSGSFHIAFRTSVFSLLVQSFPGGGENAVEQRDKGLRTASQFFVMRIVRLHMAKR